jgi:pimeloyl-ACP methyl ester carboxylesterase
MNDDLIDLSTGTTVAVTDVGDGRPLVLLHGVCMSRHFFSRNIDALADRHRVIALDFRGHGASPSSEGGHSIAQYARDVRALIEQLGLQGAVLMGWSMGSLVAWEYQRQFAGDTRLAGVVIISQGPSDLSQDDWPNGIAEPLELGTWLEAMQDDFRGFFAEFVPAMFKTPPSQAEQTAMLDAICGIDPNAGTLIVADQTLRDLRPAIPAMTLPHLLVWGTDEGVIKRASGAWLAESLPNATLHVFEDSGHCPMWEEPARFNALVAEFVRGLNG